MVSVGPDGFRGEWSYLFTGYKLLLTSNHHILWCNLLSLVQTEHKPDLEHLHVCFAETQSERVQRLLRI